MDESESESSWLESLRQQAVVGVVIGIRRVGATFWPPSQVSLNIDEANSNALLSRGQYQRAFEVATGFQEYFQIRREGKLIGASGNESAAVMLGHATGFNQAASAYLGETRSGVPMDRLERLSCGVDAVARLTSTVLTVVGGVQAGSAALESVGNVKVVSPVFRFAERDIVVVESKLGRQAFYRSSGANSGSPGKWYPVDEIYHPDGWFNKAQYTQGPGLEKGAPLHRLGTKEFADISKKLGKMSIPRGQPVPAGQVEGAEVTVNRLLDFFRARRTSTTAFRPVPDPG